MSNQMRIAAPSTTIWGRVQHRQKLADGVYNVETASHGGVVVNVLVADRHLSDKAKAVIGNPEHGWWHFEEDCDWAIFANENRDIVPQRWLEYIDGSLQQWNQDYLSLTTAEIIAKRKAEREEQQRQYEAYDARRAVEDSYRRKLTADGWKSQTYQFGNMTITVEKPADGSEKYPSTFSIGNDPKRIDMRLETLLIILTQEEIEQSNK